MKIFLYGPSGSGKSTLGRLLAEALNLPFLDLDTEVEAQAGMPIPRIFALEGEVGFRARERAALDRILVHDVGVVALGGGALLEPESRTRVEAAGRVLLLTASVEKLLACLQAEDGHRPLLAGNTNQRLRDLLLGRADHYASFARQLDTTNLTPEQAAWEAQIILGAFRVDGMGPGYDVRVRAGGLDALGDALRLRGLEGPVAVVSDDNVGALYIARVTESLRNSGFSTHAISISPGEVNKTMGTISRLWEDFLQGGLERGSTVLALGGGVVIDLAGFAAATFLRGIPWVAVPTSLLAMVDASLGGKTGVNLPQGKNLVGAFHPPRLVMADPEVLGTLPETELRSGLAEVVKHGVVGDPTLFARCAEGWSAIQSGWRELVRRGVAVKIKVVQDDPFECGERAALNLGHTIGHAVEVVSDYQLRHGEAIAMGMVVEARFAERLGLARKGLADRLAAVLTGLHLPTEIPAWLDRAALVRAMEVDKKRARGAVRFTLPLRVGEVRVGVEVRDLTSVIGG